jgi:hypothetical protein
VLVSCELAIFESGPIGLALTGASRPSLPTGETNRSASDLALLFLSPAGRDARTQGGSEGKLTIIKHDQRNGGVME